MPNRIKALRRSAGMTQQDLADRLGVDKSTVWRYESGALDLFQKSASEIARVLGVVSPEHLLTSFPDPVRLIGNVGAGAEVIPLDDETIWIDAPPGLHEPMAVEVVGRSMMPVYRPRDVLFAERRDRAADDVIGQDCIVQVTDGRRLVKRVQRGHIKGMYRLYSYDTQDETDDLALDWAAPVRWISRPAP